MNWISGESPCLTVRVMEQTPAPLLVPQVEQEGGPLATWPQTSGSAPAEGAVSPLQGQGGTKGPESHSFSIKPAPPRSQKIHAEKFVNSSDTASPRSSNIDVVNILSCSSRKYNSSFSDDSEFNSCDGIHEEEANWEPKLKKKETTAQRTVYYTNEFGYYRQCFQPKFEYPQTCGDFVSCRSQDFLLVFVGLVNILLLQFMLVIVMYFSRQDLFSPPDN